MDRRQFLRTTGIVAATGAAASIAAGCDRASETCRGGHSYGGAAAKLAKNSFAATQVLVVGGGPAGVCAAIAAAREGAATMIVEASGCLGGMGTSGLVSPFMTCYDTTGEIQVIRGLFEEIVQRMVAIGGAINPAKVRATTPYSAWITAGHDHCTPFEAEAMKFVLDQMCAEAGVKVLLHATFVDVMIKGDKVSGVTVLCKEGLQNIGADIVVDCTGDGDVAFRAGVPTVFGNPDTGGVQPCTLFFTINNVNSRKLEADVMAHLHEFRKVDGVSYRALHWRVAQAEAAGEWDIARKSVNIYKKVKDDEWAVNCTRISKLDATQSEELSRGEVEGRRQVQELMGFFHKYVPGCEKATLMSSGAYLGIRESRHIEGLHTLRAQDLIDAKVPQDSILVASNSVDVHGKGGSSSATEYTTVKGGRWYGVPYGCLVPKGVRGGLLVAGRCLSATSDAAGAVRVMPPVMAMGQAAGIAAALCVRNGWSPAEADTDLLRARLLERGAFLG